MAIDLVFTIRVCSSCKQMHAGIMFRPLALLALELHGEKQIKIDEIDPQLKKEFSQIFD